MSGLIVGALEEDSSVTNSVSRNVREAHLSGGLRIWLFSIVGDMGAARASLIALEPTFEVLTTAMDAIVDDRASKGCRWLNYLGLRSSNVLNERNRTSS